MAGVEDLFKGNIGTGLVAGLGAAIVAPVLAPMLGTVLRPAAKMVVRAGLYASEMGREVMARANDATGDLVAEVRSEMEQGRSAQGHEGGERRRGRHTGTESAAG